MIDFFGVKLIGVTPENGRKLLLTLIFVGAIYGLSRILRVISGATLKHGLRKQRVDFWLRQAISLTTAIILVLGLVSIWFNNPASLGSAFGFLTAGLAFALQKVVTAFAAYVVILRGKNFNVGDRIQMANVRGDVIALGFMQTTIMEMGEPPAEQSDPPGMWVRARQYTGRIVTITNDKIFENPVYNYSREFPFLWEELNVPISYKQDRRRAEKLILEAVGRHVEDINQLGQEDLKQLEERYFMRATEMAPRVFWRLTDNWIEMSVRFLARPYGVRELKDAISRDIIDAFDRESIGIASGTYEIVGIPPVEVQMGAANGSRSQERDSTQREEVNTR